MDLNKKTAIMVASAEPIRGLLREMVEETDGRTRYLAGKVTTQAFVNGLILWLGAKQSEDRARVVNEALRLIAAIEQDAMTVEDVKASRDKLGKAVLADSASAGGERPPAGLVVHTKPKAAPVGDQAKERQLGQVYIPYDTTKNAAAAAARAAEEAGGEDADRLKGDERAVGKRRRTPGGK